MRRLEISGRLGNVSGVCAQLERRPRYRCQSKVNLTIRMMCYNAASRAMVCWACLPCQRALCCTTSWRAAWHESGWLREETLDAPPQNKDPLHRNGTAWRSCGRERGGENRRAVRVSVCERDVMIRPWPELITITNTLSLRPPLLSERLTLRGQTTSHE